MRGILTNLHAHTNFSDGKHSIEDTVKAAINRGFTGIGISDHMYSPMYENGSIKQGKFADYLSEIRAVAAKYPEISVYAGGENESCYWQPTEELDYVIGAVHYIPHHETEYSCVDYMPGTVEALVREIFGGDYIKMTRCYYELIADMAITNKPDIIGHFDIIAKLNRKGGYFDTRSDGYMRGVMTALEAIADTGCIIEVNTGAMARGDLPYPYPERHILEEIFIMNIPVMITSDSHRSEDLSHAFDEVSALLKDIGFTSTRQLIDGRFTDIEL